MTWSAGASLTPKFTLETKPYVIEDAQGYLWAVWESYRSSNWDIYGRRFDGTGWLAEERLTNHPSIDLAPALVQLANSTILLVWSSDRPGEFSLYSKRFSGGLWSEESRLTWSSGKNSLPALFQSRNGTLWAFWTREALSGRTVIRDIYYKSYASSVWSSENPFQATGASESQPSLFETDDGTLWALFASNQPGNFDLFYRALTPAGWSPQTQLTFNTDDDRQPWIMQDLNGTIWVFWARCIQSGQVCQDDIFYKTSSDLGGSWSPEVRFTTDPQGVEVFDSEPAAINARDKRIYLFWSSSITGDGGDFDIYYSTSDPISFHDLVALSPTMAQYKPRQGDLFTATVRVRNGGDFPDNANLTVKIDGSIIGAPKTLLQPGQSASFSYNWDTNNKALGPHDLNVTVATVQGEALTSNNLVSTKFYVLSSGDVQRDGLVNVVDLVMIGASFGSSVGGATFNPEANLNQDGRLDVIDLAITGSRFGQQVALPPDFDLASNLYYPKLLRGSATSITITVRSVNGLSSPVFLGATTTAPGVAVNLSPNPVIPPGASTLTLTASPTSVPGNFTLTVTGTNATVSKSINLSLLVSSADFTISANPTSLTIIRGGAGQNVILTLDYLGLQGDVNRDGSVNIVDMARVAAAFGSTSGSPGYDPIADINQDGTVNILDLTIVGGNFGKTNLVTLAVTGVPPGVTVTLTPNSLNPPGTSTLTLTASATAATGIFSITITGTSTGSSQSVSMLLTVA